MSERCPAAKPITVTLDGGELVIRIKTDPTPADELVDVARCGLERRAVDTLIHDGRLRAVKIGRRLYVRRSALLALVDTLPSVGPTKRQPKKATGGKVFDFARAAKEAGER